MRKRWPDLPAFAPPQALPADRLTITSMRGWRLKEPVSGRRYTVVKLQNQGGISGFGEGAQVHGSDIAEARSAVVGRRSTETEFIRHALDKTPAMEAAITNAMLDLTSRSAKVPIYQYLGGPTRYKARGLAHLEGETDDELVAALQRSKAQGFRVFSFPVPARDALWRMQTYVDVIRKRFEALRAAGGADTDYVIDGRETLTPGDASFIAKALERSHLIWLDEPTPVLTNDALSRISDESVMPMGLGRNIHDVTTFQNLLRWGCVDILRPSIGLNSINKIRRMAAVAEVHYVAVGPYHNGGPIGAASAINLAASLPNFYIQQIPQPAAEQDRRMRAELTSGNREVAVNGFLQLINKPGLGFDVNEQALNQYSEETI